MKYLRNTRIEKEFAERKAIRMAKWNTYLDITLLATMEEFSKKMAEQGISRADLAAILGTSRSYVTQVMSGFPDMKLSTFFKLSFALGLKPKIELCPIIKTQSKQFQKESNLVFSFPQSNELKFIDTQKYEQVSKVG